MTHIESTARSDQFRASRFVWGALACLTSLGCGAESESHQSELVELERLAFVSEGSTEFTGGEGPRSVRHLLVDRFEVTRGQWRAWLASEVRDGEPVSDSLALSAEYPPEWSEGPDSWPAAFMTYAEAEAFAEARGMRIPTASEWFFVAMGRRGQKWPWGQYGAQSASNTQEIGLGSPSPVGVFEQGKTVHGVYDLIGNVWEWVDGALPREALRGSEFVWAAGGSFKWPLRELYLSPAAGGFFVQRESLTRASRSTGVGFRCVADAEAYLVRELELLPADRETRDRLRRIGARWGRSAVPLLKRLVGGDSKESALSLLLEGASR